MNAIIASNSASKSEDLAAWVADQDLEVSKHAETLVQLDNGKQVPLSNWKCEREGCDKTENLWLNLSDGFIFCGRRNFDGSGGNGHALDHYEQTGFPLSVKIGTITPKGAGTFCQTFRLIECKCPLCRTRTDVFDYVKGDMVLDPKLPEHLAHWGIDMHKMEKVFISANGQ